MAPVYLIDGYNLLHAMGFAPPRSGSPVALERARNRMLAFLANSQDPTSQTLMVVFDAAGAPSKADAERNYRGMHIIYAVAYQEADDLIEELIRKNPTPNNLTVISDDHRLQRAAQRGKSQFLGCLDYLDLLDKQERIRRGKDYQSDKLQPSNEISASENQYWREIFADLDNDPAMKELFEIFDFSEVEEEEKDPPKIKKPRRK